MLLYIWLVAIFGAAYLYLRHVYLHFSRRGVKHLTPVPILGNLARPVLRMEHFTELVNRIYKAFPDERFVGMYEFLNPVVFVRDPALIKQICVKDFDHFLDHRVKINEDNDPLFGRNLFSLKGQKWRDMRSTLSPAFTGSKMRHMVPFMLDCAHDMSLALKQQMENKNEKSLDLDFKDLCTRFSNDVVASCAFGLKVNSHSDPNNTFYQMGKAVSNFSFKILLKFFGFTSFPYIMDKLKLSLFDHDITFFFRNLVNDTMKDRDARKIIRPDMIHLLMEAKKGNLSHEGKVDEDAGFATVEESAVGMTTNRRVWADDDLVAQAVLFFIAGFDTIATAITFTLYELAINPDVQDKLIKEIDETNKDRREPLSYKEIQEMKYMDMVMSESLRKWSPGVSADRICVKPYNLGKPNPKATEDYIVKEGQGMWLPVWSIHHDPEYYPDPEKFDPERFSEENKHKIDPATYMPFGSGPRNCIGSRFALMEAKIMIHQLLSQFRVTPSSKTKVPLELDTNTFNLRMRGGHWLRLQMRQ